jgi:phosphohistidine phosphatase
MDQQAPKFANHVIVMRHAHPLEQFAGSDFDRPLSPKGRVAARQAALALHSAGHHPGPLLVSAALCARQTAEILAGELNIPGDDIYVTEVLYGAPPEVLEARIRVLAVPYTLVTLIGHHPEVTDLARFLAREPGAPALEPAEWRYLPWPPPT